jgi:hypothetical protein
MSLRVIGAGFGRTGTLSLKLALEELGYGPCYHMVETFAHPEHDAMWLAIARGEASNWQTILSGYAAVVDWPAVMVWREMVAANPQAKVILTLRDPDAWYESARATIFGRMRHFADVLADKGEPVDAARAMHMQMVNAVVVDRGFGGNLDEAHAIAAFNAHNEEVCRTVPPQRLLVFEPGHGWDKLCAFLDVPVPAIAYPKVNTTEDFTAHFPARR